MHGSLLMEMRRHLLVGAAGLLQPVRENGEVLGIQPGRRHHPLGVSGLGHLHHLQPLHARESPPVFERLRRLLGGKSKP